MSCINDMTTYFNEHQMAGQRLINHRIDDSIRNGRLNMEAWNSFQQVGIRSLAPCGLTCHSMLQLQSWKWRVTFLMMIFNLCQMKTKKPISEIIIVFAAIRRVGRKLESHQRVSMSRTPIYSQEFGETLMIMAVRHKNHAARRTTVTSEISRSQCDPK